MVHSNDDTPSNLAAAGMSPSHVSSGNSNANSNTTITTSNNNAKITSNPDRSPRIRPGNMNPVNIYRNHLNLRNTVPISGPTPNCYAMGALQQHQLIMHNLLAGGQVSTRFHFTTNSVPPSPTFHPNIHPSHNHGHRTPLVPKLNIAPPGLPLHANTYDCGDDCTDPAFGSSSPYMRATKSAVNTALANERDRIKSLELQEKELFAELFANL